MAEALDQDVGQGVLAGLLRARDQARLDQGAAAALPRLQPATPTRAASNAVARAAERFCGLAATPLDLTPAAITLAEMAELLPRPALFSVVEGSEDAIGVVALCPEVMTALIEVQTLGRITARSIEARRPTRSDAMICADFVNALLAELGVEMTRIDGFEGFGGFRYASFVDDPRPLLLLLEDSPYRSLRFRLRLGQSPAREGEIFVALPQKQVAAAPASARDQFGPAAPAAPRPGAASASPAPAELMPDQSEFLEQVQQAAIELVGVLCRRRLRLGLLRGLQPGQILPLPRVELAETRLETRLGQVLAIGKLGEVEGYHAIRLRNPAEGAYEAPGAADRSFGPPVAVASGAKRAADGPPPRGTVSEPPIGDLDGPDSFRPAAQDAVRPDNFPASAPKSALSG